MSCVEAVDGSYQGPVESVVAHDLYQSMVNDGIDHSVKVSGQYS